MLIFIALKEIFCTCNYTQHYGRWLEMDLYGVLYIALFRTIGTLEALVSALRGQFMQCIRTDHMATTQPHGRIGFRGLRAENGTREGRVNSLGHRHVAGQLVDLQYLIVVGRSAS